MKTKTHIKLRPENQERLNTDEPGPNAVPGSFESMLVSRWRGRATARRSAVT